MNVKLLFLYLIVFGILPALALAGTFQQVIVGNTDPEISVISSVDMGTLTVGKSYYWAGDGVGVEANTGGETVGAKPVIIANLSSNITARVLLCYYGAWEWNNLLSKNLKTITLYYDRDAQFGNENEVELEDYNPDDRWAFLSYKQCHNYVPTGYNYPVSFGVRDDWSASAQLINIANPLNQNEKLYLVATSGDFGPEEAGGEWKVTVGLTAKAV